MVRQWQELNHGSRYSESYSASLPDFVKLAETFGMTGLRAQKSVNWMTRITTMLNTDGPVIADICIEKEENCFPMIPSGAAHNEMILTLRMKRQTPYQMKVKSSSNYLAGAALYWRATR